MNRATSFGVGLCAAAIISVNAYEFTHDTLEKISDIDEKTEAANACLHALYEETVIVTAVPEGCGPYEAQFVQPPEELPDDYPEDVTFYELPEKDPFIQKELQALENQEAANKKTEQAAALITGLGGLVIGYSVARGKDGGI